MRTRALTVALASTVVLGAAGCNRLADDAFCGPDHCEFTASEWRRVRSLANISEAPLDTSNRLITNPKNSDAIALGQRFYFEPRFSGDATWIDTIARPTTSARAEINKPIDVSCSSCHDPARAGGDFTSQPGPIAEGAGWYDVNGQQTLNASHYKLLYWNGRSDSLWSQAAAVMESNVSMNGTRLAILWTVADHYRAAYETLFGPLPMTGTSAQVQDLLADRAKPDGPCAGTPPVCQPGCRMVTNTAGTSVCWPVIPLAGKPGSVSGCQAGDPSSTEPAGDAYDCLDPGTKDAVNRAYSNVAKAIAAYEWELTSVNAPFDRFVNGENGALGPDAERGLKLFVGRASCIDCHNTPLLSDGQFHDIGVPQTGTGVPTEADCPRGNPHCDCVTLPNSPGSKVKLAGDTCIPWGAYYGFIKLESPTFRRDGPYSDDPAGAKLAYADAYAQAAAPPASLRGAWRTPSLRDVALTAPYMHDGYYRTLEDVIWHYDQGGTGPATGTKAPELHPLLLTDEERADLAAFLRSLTGVPGRPDLIAAPEPTP